MYSILRSKKYHIDLSQTSSESQFPKTGSQQQQESNRSLHPKPPQEPIVCSCFIDDLNLLCVFKSGRYIVARFFEKQDQQLGFKKSHHNKNQDYERKESKNNQNEIIYDGNIVSEWVQSQQKETSNSENNSTFSKTKAVLKNIPKLIFHSCKRLKPGYCVIMTKNSKELFLLTTKVNEEEVAFPNNSSKQTPNEQIKKSLQKPTKIQRLPDTMVKILLGNSLLDQQIERTNTQELSDNDQFPNTLNNGFTILSQIVVFTNKEEDGFMCKGEFLIRNSVIQDKVIYLTLYKLLYSLGGGNSQEETSKKSSKSESQFHFSKCDQKQHKQYLLRNFEIPIPINDNIYDYIFENMMSKNTNEMIFFNTRCELLWKRRVNGVVNHENDFDFGNNNEDLQNDEMTFVIYNFRWINKNRTKSENFSHQLEMKQDKERQKKVTSDLQYFQTELEADNRSKGNKLKTNANTDFDGDFNLLIEKRTVRLSEEALGLNNQEDSDGIQIMAQNNEQNENLEMIGQNFENIQAADNKIMKIEQIVGWCEHMSYLIVVSLLGSETKRRNLMTFCCRLKNDENAYDYSDNGGSGKNTKWMEKMASSERENDENKGLISYENDSFKQYISKMLGFDLQMTNSLELNAKLNQKCQAEHAPIVFERIIHSNWKNSLYYVLYQRFDESAAKQEFTNRGEIYQNRIDLIDIEKGNLIENGLCNLKNYEISPSQKYILDMPTYFAYREQIFYHIRLLFDKRFLYLFMIRNSTELQGMMGAERRGQRSGKQFIVKHEGMKSESDGHRREKNEKMQEFGYSYSEQFLEEVLKLLG